MKLNEAIKLIGSADINREKPVIWADLGCGSGLFTSALASLLAPDSIIYAIDRSSHDLSGPVESGVTVQFIRTDFEKDKLPLPALDGILMANALHFVSGKPSFLDKIQKFLKPDGKFIIVEYDTTRSNPWVPYPVDFSGLKQLFKKAGFNMVTKLNERKSLYGHKNMYSALIERG